MRSRLDVSPEEVRALGLAAVEAAARYYERLPDMRIIRETTAAAVRANFAEGLPREGVAFDEILAQVTNAIFPYSRQNGHPRFFGYVASPGTAITAAADLLVSTLNSNVTAWRSGPAATAVEHVAIGWLKEMLGLPAEAMGLFVSGGSMANFAGLAAVRARFLPDAGGAGMRGQRQLRVYVSAEGHYSIAKAADLLGIGKENVRTVRTDNRFRLDVASLDAAIRDDRAAGFTPACVVANAGTVNTGAVDPLEEVAAVARRSGLWMHVDGAYGGFAALSETGRALLTGIEKADSVSLDPHKWLYTSMGCGCILYRDGAAARAAFAHDAEYTRPVGLSYDEAFAFWDYGPELSRRFRALPVWMQFKYAGADALGAAIEENIGCAKYLEQAVMGTNDFEMLAPVELSIFCFRHRPDWFTGDLDSFNERVLIELQRAGSSYMSNARVNGQFALRGCVLNYRTTRADMDRLLEDVRAAGRRVRDLGGIWL